MTVSRQDAWTHDEDLLLAEVVLRHIREGSTQLAAFEEVGRELSRTPAACGFRWNSAIRKKYEAAISLAKRQRMTKTGEKEEVAKDQEMANVEAAEEISQQPEQKEKREQEQREDHKPVYEHTFLTSVDRSSDKEKLDEIVFYLQDLKTRWNGVGEDKKDLEMEVKRLREENEKLEKEMERLRKDYQVIKHDYRSFLSLMDRAKQLSVSTITGDAQSKG